MTSRNFDDYSKDVSESSEKWREERKEEARAAVEAGLSLEQFVDSFRCRWTTCDLYEISYFVSLKIKKLEELLK